VRQKKQSYKAKQNPFSAVVDRFEVTDGAKLDLMHIKPDEDGTMAKLFPDERQEDF
jgi:hypothetical protein